MEALKIPLYMVSKLRTANGYDAEQTGKFLRDLSMKVRVEVMYVDGSSVVFQDGVQQS